MVISISQSHLVQSLETEEQFNRGFILESERQELDLLSTTSFMIKAGCFTREWQQELELQIKTQGPRQLNAAAEVHARGEVQREEMLGWNLLCHCWSRVMDGEDLRMCDLEEGIVRRKIKETWRRQRQELLKLEEEAKGVLVANEIEKAREAAAGVAHFERTQEQDRETRARTDLLDKEDSEWRVLALAAIQEIEIAKRNWIEKEIDGRWQAWTLESTCLDTCAALENEMVTSCRHLKELASLVELQSDDRREAAKSEHTCWMEIEQALLDGREGLSRHALVDQMLMSCRHLQELAGLEELHLSDRREAVDSEHMCWTETEVSFLDGCERVSRHALVVAEEKCWNGIITEECEARNMLMRQGIDIIEVHEGVQRADIGRDEGLHWEGMRLECEARERLERLVGNERMGWNILMIEESEGRERVDEMVRDEAIEWNGLMLRECEGRVRLGLEDQRGHDLHEFCIRFWDQNEWVCRDEILRDEVLCWNGIVMETCDLQATYTIIELEMQKRLHLVEQGWKAWDEMASLFWIESAEICSNGLIKHEWMCRHMLEGAYCEECEHVGRVQLGQGAQQEHDEIGLRFLEGREGICRSWIHGTVDCSHCQHELWWCAMNECCIIATQAGSERVAMDFTFLESGEEVQRQAIWYAMQWSTLFRHHEISSTQIVQEEKEGFMALSESLIYLKSMEKDVNSKREELLLMEAGSRHAMVHKELCQWASMILSHGEEWGRVFNVHELAALWQRAQLEMLWMNTMCPLLNEWHQCEERMSMLGSALAGDSQIQNEEHCCLSVLKMEWLTACINVELAQVRGLEMQRELQARMDILISFEKESRIALHSQCICSISSGQMIELSLRAKAVAGDIAMEEKVCRRALYSTLHIGIDQCKILCEAELSHQQLAKEDKLCRADLKRKSRKSFEAIHKTLEARRIAMQIISTEDLYRSNLEHEWHNEWMRCDILLQALYTLQHIAQNEKEHRDEMEEALQGWLDLCDLAIQAESGCKQIMMGERMCRDNLERSCRKSKEECLEQIAINKMNAWTTIAVVSTAPDDKCASRKKIEESLDSLCEQWQRNANDIQSEEALTFTGIVKMGHKWIKKYKAAHEVISRLEKKRGRHSRSNLLHGHGGTGLTLLKSNNQLQPLPNAHQHRLRHKAHSTDATMFDSSLAQSAPEVSWLGESPPPIETPSSEPLINSSLDSKIRLTGLTDLASSISWLGDSPLSDAPGMPSRLERDPAKSRRSFTLPTDLSPSWLLDEDEAQIDTPGLLSKKLNQSKTTSKIREAVATVASNSADLHHPALDLHQDPSRSPGRQLNLKAIWMEMDSF